MNDTAKTADVTDDESQLHCHQLSPSVTDEENSSHYQQFSAFVTDQENSGFPLGGLFKFIKRWRCICIVACDGDKKPGLRGDYGVSRNTIVQGMPESFRPTCGDYACVLSSNRTRGCGCGQRPAFPAPSVVRGRYTN